ncbi:hypothetical protein [Flavipsychrobacter stenotrophus]|nr:hypothetical protein [Flavipsychrobacter stenotrophus]
MSKELIKIFVSGFFATLGGLYGQEMESLKPITIPLCAATGGIFGILLYDIFFVLIYAKIGRKKLKSLFENHSVAIFFSIFVLFLTYSFYQDTYSRLLYSQYPKAYTTLLNYGIFVGVSSLCYILLQLMIGYYKNFIIDIIFLPFLIFFFTIINTFIALFFTVILAKYCHIGIFYDLAGQISSHVIFLLFVFVSFFTNWFIFSHFNEMKKILFVFKSR